MKSDITVDARGELGAIPILQASRELTHMKPGEVLELLADKESVLDDIKELESRGTCQLLSHEFSKDGEGDDGLKAYIKKL
ncbi:MAG: sulfurtransferase TusA family protein [Thermodesulfovibrionales bacterium]|nr:sulfurtransferase TusA family protein [Thermodesulfovibrionales bacterium]